MRNLNKDNFTLIVPLLSGEYGSLHFAETCRTAAKLGAFNVTCYKQGENGGLITAAEIVENIFDSGRQALCVKEDMYFVNLKMPFVCWGAMEKSLNSLECSLFKITGNGAELLEFQSKESQEAFIGETLKGKNPEYKFRPLIPA